MPEAKFPPIAELLPHGSRAILLERVISHDAATTACTVDPSAGAHFRDTDGALPACIGLEIMAQAIAAHGGLLDRAAGREARPGFFLGSRRLALAVPRFEAGQRLVATATHLRGTIGLLAFDCSIRAEDDATELLASGVLTVYLLESFEALTRDFATAD